VENPAGYPAGKIRYPAFRLAEYAAGRPDIRQNPYPVNLLSKDVAANHWSNLRRIKKICKHASGKVMYVT
jgi:hypothetical protein